MIERTTFTFLTSHTGPDGTNLGKRYVDVVGPLHNARRTMLTLFGNRFDSEYAEGQVPNLPDFTLYCELLAIGTTVHIDGYEGEQLTMAVQDVRWCQSSDVCGDTAPHAEYAFKAKELVWTCHAINDITLPADPLDLAPALNDEQWAAVLAAGSSEDDWDNFAVGHHGPDFFDARDLLAYAIDAVGSLDPSTPLALPALDGMGIEDSSAGKADDMVLIVTVVVGPTALRLASEPVAYAELAPEGMTGPEAARAVLAHLVTERNALISGLRAALTAHKVAG